VHPSLLLISKRIIDRNQAEYAAKNFLNVQTNVNKQCKTLENSVQNLLHIEQTNILTYQDNDLTKLENYVLKNLLDDDVVKSKQQTSMHKIKV
jgi:hypothetical protein